MRKIKKTSQNLRKKYFLKINPERITQNERKRREFQDKVDAPRKEYYIRNQND